MAEKVLPHADRPLSRTNPVLQGRIAHCVRGERSPTSRDLQMYYFEKADIPCWLNQVKFDAGGCEFQIETTEVGFSVTAKSDATIPKHFHVRVEESLRLPPCTLDQLPRADGTRPAPAFFKQSAITPNALTAADRAQWPCMA